MKIIRKLRELLKRKKKADKKIVLSTLPIDADIEIKGHIFHGLKDIRKNTTNYSRIQKHHDFERHQWVAKDVNPVDGIYILEMYEPYPTFEGDNEDRTYSNFFFSKKPFTVDRIDKIAEMKHGLNDQIVLEDMDPDLVPAIYNDGNYKTMIVAQFGRKGSEDLIK